MDDKKTADNCGDDTPVSSSQPSRRGGREISHTHTCCLCGIANHNENIGYFRFPNNNNLCNIWTDYTGLPHLIRRDVSKLQNVRLCSLHFNPEDVKRCKTRQVLKRGAIPCVPFDNATRIRRNKKQIYDKLNQKTVDYDDDRFFEDEPSEDEEMTSDTNVHAVSADDSSLETDENFVSTLKIINCRSVPVPLEEISLQVYVCYTSTLASESVVGVPILQTGGIDNCQQSQLQVKSSTALFTSPNSQSVPVGNDSCNVESTTSTCQILKRKRAAVKLTTNKRHKRSKRIRMMSSFRLENKSPETHPNEHIQPPIRRKAVNMWKSCHFPKNVFRLMKSTILRAKKKPKPRRWNSFDKAVSLNVFLHNSAAYNALSKTVPLPSARTLQRSMHGVGETTGFCQEVLLSLKLKVKNMQPKDKLCVLVFDEMAIKPGVTYCKCLDRVLGFEDFGPNIPYRKKVATNMLVVMARGLCAKWKQVVGYFFPHKGTPAELLKEIIFKAVCLLTEIGLEPTAIVCDQSFSNQKLFELLGVSASKPYFDVNCRRVYSFFDPPSLLKSIRNNLMKYDISFSCLPSGSEDNVGTAKWNVVQEFYEAESKYRYRACPKVTEAHVRPNSVQKRNVQLAVQIFSKTVAGALCACGSFTSSEAYRDTADFCGEMDDLFDSVNGRSSKRVHKMKKLLNPVRVDSLHKKTWCEKLKWVETLKFKTQDGQTITVPPCKAGWVLTLSAFISLWDDLQDKGMETLLPSRLNYDCLKREFMSIKSKRLESDKFGVVQLKSSMQDLMVKNMLSVIKANKSRVVDADILSNASAIKQLRPFFQYTWLEHLSELPGELAEGVTRVCNDVCTPEEINCVTYVAGYLLAKTKKCIGCKKCTNQLTCEESELFQFLAELKQFNLVKHGLIVPSSCFVTVVRNMGEVLGNHILNVLFEPAISEVLSTILNKNVSFDSLRIHEEHASLTKTFVIKMYVMLMLVNKLKWKN